MSIYVLYVQSNKENDVMYDLQDKGFTAYVPREKYTYRKGGKWHTEIRVLFDGYVFVELPNINGDNYYVIKNTYGVGNFVSKTTNLSDTEAEYIKGLCNNGNIIETSVGHIENGVLKIDDGFLKQYEHKIVKYSRRQHRATVEITIYGEPYRITCAINIA